MTTARPYIPRPGKPAPQTARFPRDRKRQLQVWWREIDRVLLMLVLALMTLGTIAVLAASPASADRLSTADQTLDPLYFFMRHIIWQVAALGVMLGTSLLPQDMARREAILLSAAMLVMLLLVPLIGVEKNGATRWLNLGIVFQPSEFLKPAFAVTLAWILSWKIRDPSLPVIGISAALVGTIVFLLMAQPNFGEAILFVGSWFVLVMLAGLPLQRIGILAGVGLAGLVLAYSFYENARNRIDSFLGGGSAFDQVDLASRTLMGGGWTGTGLGLGRQKMNLPEAHTDYIFSVIGEEFGLLACMVIVALYLAIVVRVLVRLMDEDRLFNILAASGLIALFGGQAFINILVNLQLFPSKGMTLPLVSYGGSSTIAQCFTIGMLLTITRRNPYLSREAFDLRGSLEKETRP
ncbi:putative lipid II flippase FtsW [Alteraurantiacibacter aestuarii]|uniref:Probable peptidoglycan glycosyltransferase FtsW n=1 Tax=Alteraurantiacibacter aestuarii TaxID=650004 RepID=A0A844ZQ86_9SPHN|nr:putative peptidoglycan glycosyltransferase FtsW [Alteraurantiacibacter aestuarii]MXO88957.1 cell division protein FtsW [Alteraurantiacibacter aestuarii]